MSLKVIGFGTSNYGAFQVVRLTNAGPRSIRYRGYDTNLPWYAYRLQAKGSTTNYSHFWCGTGLRECGLGALQSVDFDVPAITNGEYRIALPYTLPSPLDKLRDVGPHWIASRLPMPRDRCALTVPLQGKSSD